MTEQEKIKMLIEALEAFIEDIRKLAESGDCGYFNAEEQDIVVQARKAIAKARGEK